MSESILEFINKKEFNKSVEGIIQTYTQLEEQVRLLRTECNNLQAKLNDQYANDKEIVRLREVINKQNIELINGFGITKEENDAISEWERKHNLEKHGSETVYHGAAGGGMTYIFIPTGIGIISKVRCSCGEEFCFRDL